MDFVLGFIAGIIAEGVLLVLFCLMAVQKGDQNDSKGIS